MSKATITLVANGDGTMTVECDFDPPVNDNTNPKDHPTAFHALAMLNVLKAQQNGFEFDDDEEDE